jgi:hypothetical protein
MPDWTKLEVEFSTIYMASVTSSFYNQITRTKSTKPFRVMVPLTYFALKSVEIYLTRENYFQFKDSGQLQQKAAGRIPFVTCSIAWKIHVPFRTATPPLADLRAG